MRSLGTAKLMGLVLAVIFVGSGVHVKRGRERIGKPAADGRGGGSLHQERPGQVAGAECKRQPGRLGEGYLHHRRHGNPGGAGGRAGDCRAGGFGQASNPLRRLAVARRPGSQDADPENFARAPHARRSPPELRRSPRLPPAWRALTARGSGARPAKTSAWISKT